MHLIILSCIALCSVHVTVGQTSVNHRFATNTVLGNIHSFSASLYKSVAGNQKQNFIIAPISAYIGLGMASFGAGNESLQVLRSQLPLPNDEITTFAGLYGMWRMLNIDNNGVSMKIANKIFLSNRINPKPKFRRITNSLFNSSIELLNNSNNGQSTQIISRWVDLQTSRSVKKNFSTNAYAISIDATSQSELMVLNTIYFSSDFLTPFNAKWTQPKPFKVSENVASMVDMMYCTGTFVRGKIIRFNSDFIVLPYKNTNLTMMIITPLEGFPLAEIEENLDFINPQNLWNSTFVQYHTAKVDFSLPKFKITSTLNLQDPLARMEMSKLFDNKADFQEIGDGILSLSRTVQNIVIEVKDSEVTETIPPDASFSIEWPEIMTVDQPSLVIIRFNEINLFVGRLIDPSI